ncbi:MAG: sigma-70 family RNA polymerase sigma factor [Thermoleophilia bacterium]|nr:sigma-70 family RNA polymerase sigma factor [Thermoleophilia bacterium]
MALSDDQRAMLRLLAQREQGYEDIAALMGLSVDDVRAKVKEALAQLEDEGAEVPALPPEPPAVAPPPVAPPAPEPPPVVKQPPAEPPVAPEPPAVAPEPAAPVATQPTLKKDRPKPALPTSNGARAAIAAGVAAVIVVVLLLALGGSDSGNGDSTTAANAPASEEPADSEAETASNAKQPTVATLAAVDGSDASGRAVFGRVEDSLALGIQANGLEPNPKGSVYMVWLAQSSQRMLPLTAIAVPKSGRINAQYEVPTEAVVYLATGKFDRLVLTRAENAPLRASLEKANEEKQVPAYTGTPVLEGTVEGPIVGAEARLKAREEAEDGG